MKDYMDTATNPQIAVPVTGVASLTSAFADNLPVIINIGWALYLALLIGHKAWTWYKQWKGKDEPKE